MSQTGAATLAPENDIVRAQRCDSTETGNAVHPGAINTDGKKAEANEKLTLQTQSREEGQSNSGGETHTQGLNDKQDSATASPSVAYSGNHQTENNSVSLLLYAVCNYVKCWLSAPKCRRRFSYTSNAVHNSMTLTCIAGRYFLAVQ